MDGARTGSCSADTSGKQRKRTASARPPLQTDFLLLIERRSDIRGSRGRADRDVRHHSSVMGRLTNQRRPPSRPLSAGATRPYVPNTAFPAGCVTSSVNTVYRRSYQPITSTVYHEVILGGGSYFWTCREKEPALTSPT